MKPCIGFGISLVLCLISQSVVLGQRQGQRLRCKAKGTFVARTGECNKYVRCNGPGALRQGWLCPAGQLFDPFRHQCILAKKAFTCKACFGNNGQRIKLKNTEGTFFECVDNTPQKFQCRPTAVFDKFKMKCIKKPKGEVTTLQPKKKKTTTTRAPAVGGQNEETTPNVVDIREATPRPIELVETPPTVSEIVDATEKIEIVEGADSENPPSPASESESPAEPKPEKAKPTPKPAKAKPTEKPAKDAGAASKYNSVKDDADQVEVIEEEILPDGAGDTTNSAFDW